MTDSTPAIVTICGSMRFYDYMLQVAAQETLEGRIVLAPFCAVTPGQQDEDAKRRLDELHLRKIDLAERIIVVTNGDGYIGESTSREVAYALSKGKAMDVRDFPSAGPVIVDGRRLVGAGHAIAR
jgi:hypothetical protein